MESVGNLLQRRHCSGNPLSSFEDVPCSIVAIHFPLAVHSAMPSEDVAVCIMPPMTARGQQHWHHDGCSLPVSNDAAVNKPATPQGRSFRCFCQRGSHCYLTIITSIGPLPPPSRRHRDGDRHGDSHIVLLPVDSKSDPILGGEPGPGAAAGAGSAAVTASGRLGHWQWQ